MKNNIQDKYKNKIEIDQNFIPKTLNGILRLYDDGSNDILSFVIAKLKDGHELISEFLYKLLSIHNFKPELTELKTMRSFILKEIQEKEFPEYSTIMSIIWGNFEKPQLIYNGIELIKVRRSSVLDACNYKFIYSIDFQPLIQSSNLYNIIYGITCENQIQVLRNVTTVQNFQIPNNWKK